MELPLSSALPLPAYRSIGAPIALTSAYLETQDPVFRSKEDWAWIAARNYYVPIPATLATFWLEHRLTPAPFHAWDTVLRAAFSSSAYAVYAQARFPVSLCAALGIIAPWPWDPWMSQYPYRDEYIALVHHPDRIAEDPWHLDPAQWQQAISLSAVRQAFPETWHRRLTDFLANPNNVWMVTAQPFERDLACQRAGMTL